MEVEFLVAVEEEREEKVFDILFNFIKKSPRNQKLAVFISRISSSEHLQS